MLDSVGIASRFAVDALVASAAGAPGAPPPGGSATAASSFRFDAADLYGAGGPSSADIRQDALGDCYFVATLGAVAQQQPGAVRDMIGFDARTGDYTVRLFDGNGQPQTVRVSQAEVQDNLTRQGGSTVDNTGLDGPIWPAVAETAYAKMHDSNPADGLTQGYIAIANGGYPRDAMRAITGDAGSEITYSRGFFESHGSAVEREAKQIDAALGNGRPVTLWTVPENRGLWDRLTGSQGTQDGLVDNHVYTVERVYRQDGEWMVSVRNPWATNQGVGEGADTAAPTMQVPLAKLADTGGAQAFTVGPARH